MSAKRGPLQWGGDAAIVDAFGRVLAAARQARGLPPVELTLAACADGPPPAGGGAVAVPHVFVWKPTGSVEVVWERLHRETAAAVLGAPIAVVLRWATRPQDAIELVRLAQSGEVTAGGEHLSFRWVVTHEALAAEVVTQGRVGLDHVSLHVSPAEEARLVELLTSAAGMVEIERPASINTPGRWLQCGNSRVHLNSREPREDEPGFPGTAPNHICFAVRNTEEVADRLTAAGAEVARAGSLGDQVWLRIAGGTVIEFQPGGASAAARFR